MRLRNPTHTIQVGSQEIPFLAAQPLGNHIGGFLSTPNLGTVSLHQPSATHAIYSRSYPHGLSLGVTAKHFPDTDWSSMNSDCESPVYGYQFQSSVAMTSPQNCGTIYPTHSNRAWSTLSDRRTDSGSSEVDKEQQGAVLSYLSSDTATRPAVTADGASPFSVVALQSSLPRASAASRQLPVPTTGMRQMVPPYIGDSAPLHLYPALSNSSRDPGGSFYNTGGIWASEQFSPDFRSGLITNPVSTSQSEPVSSTISVATPNTSNTSPQSYKGTSSSPDSSPTTLEPHPGAAPSASVIASSAINPVSALSHVANYEDSVSAHSVLRNDPSTNLADYQYSSPKLNSIRDLQSASNTLPHVQRYEPRAKPQSKRVLDAKSLRREFWENSTAAAGGAPLSMRDHDY